ncbi:MAG: isopentenyl phosphate kinase [Anaerolineales bacterium]
MIFLKLGGSLITDKAQRETAQIGILQRLAKEIAEAMRAKPETKLLVGHGSGSFGHAAAVEFGFDGGVKTAEEWRGVREVWAAANRLHRIVMDTFLEAGLPAFSFPPSAIAVSDHGEIAQLADEPIRRALDAGQLPVVQGDIVFDRGQGAAILSTENVLAHLAAELRPERILLAGIEEGVYERYPARDRVMPEISADRAAKIQLEGADSTDVTGGMAHKVEQALALAEAMPEVEVRIFSGASPGNLQGALLGYALGTRVVA